MRWGQCSESERLLVVGQFAHTRHAQIARRVNLSQGCGIAEDPKSAVCSPHPAPGHKGRFAIVTDVGYGMRWTRQRRARDGIAGRFPVSGHNAQDERRFCGRQNRVVLTPVAGAKSTEAKSAQPG